MSQATTTEESINTTGSVTSPQPLTETTQEADTHASEGGLAVLGIDTPFIVAQVVNFFILLFLLRWLLYRPILDILKKRRTTIEESLKHAEVARLEAVNAEQRSAEALRTAREQAATIVEDAKQQATVLATQLKQQAASEAESLLERTRTQLTQEKDAIVHQAQAELGNLVALATQKVIAKQDISVSDADVQAALREAKGV